MAAPNILCDTAGMTNERWLECRMHGPKGNIPYTVGGSDVATIFGVSPWVTPLELWLVKKGKIKPPAKMNPKTLEMGHLLEPIAAHFYGVKTGNTVIEDTNMYQHADFPYALADFDRRFIRADDGEPGILECKSCSYHKAGDWADGAYPLYYELQLRYYLAVADVQLGDFSALWGNNPDNDMATPSLVRDKEKFGPKTNPEGQKRRETAHNALCRAVSDHRARFSNYRPASPEQFRNDICNVISTVLNLWVSYRDTYINLYEEAKK